MATSAETRVVNAAGVVQGVALVTFPAAGTILIDPAEYDLSGTRYGMLFAAGGVIAFYQLGYGLAAFGVGPLRDAGVELSTVYGLAAIVAVAMGAWSFVVAARRPPRGASLDPLARGAAR